MTVPLNRIFISLDSNAIYPTDTLERTAIDKICRWTKEGAVLDITPSVQEEINHPHTPLEVKRFVNELGYTPVKPSLTTEEKNRFDQIRKILAGNGNVDRAHADAEHIFHAHKNAADFFVTLDERILQKREPLHKICLCSLTILKPTELVEKYNNEFVSIKALSRKRFYCRIR